MCKTYHDKQNDDILTMILKINIADWHTLNNVYKLLSEVNFWSYEKSLKSYELFEFLFIEPIYLIREKVQCLCSLLREKNCCKIFQVNKNKLKTKQA